MKEASPLPEQVASALSIPGIDPARFRDVLQSFGPIPDEGQLQLANRLIEAREQYLYYRMSWSFDTTRPSHLRDRLRAIGSASEQLRRLLHHDGADPAPWNTHHVITGALPELCRIAIERRPNQIWDPPQGVSLLSEMLADLLEAGARAEAIYPTQYSKRHGGDRKQGSSDPVANLVERLIDIYAELRELYLGSGPRPAVGKPLIQFVRAGLTFAVSTRKLPDGTKQPSFEAAFIDPDLPKKTRITDDAIKAVFQRRAARIKRTDSLI
jgi:hypothetical protein